MKVFHVQDVDYRTTAPTLVEALKQVRSWSLAHPKHVPIMILLELKQESEAVLPTKPLPFDRKGLKSLEAGIVSVFLRRDHHSGGDPWIVRDPGRRSPETRLARARRRARGVMFVLDNEDNIRDSYIEMHPALLGQLCFASVAESHPQAAWFKINDPVADFDRIRRLVGGLSGTHTG